MEIKITWKDEEVPINMMTRQIYGVLFSKDGRILLKISNCNGKCIFSLPGGTPEDFDSDRIATLRRECIEEVNTTFKSPIFYVGYQEIEGDGDRPVYAQVRMTALIDKIGKRQPDPDGGETYDRLLAPPQKAIEYMSWGEVGRKLIEKATLIAKEKLNIKFFSDKEEYV